MSQYVVLKDPGAHLRMSAILKILHTCNFKQKEIRKVMDLIL